MVHCGNGAYRKVGDDVKCPDGVTRKPVGSTMLSCRRVHWARVCRPSQYVQWGIDGPALGCRPYGVDGAEYEGRESSGAV
jgi:hypothetical protein